MAEGRFYHYDPSFFAAVIFAVVFGISTAWHGWQLAKWRTWYFIPFFVGGLFELVGYIIRSILAQQKPDYAKIPYIEHITFILLAPALYAASIYMILGRITILLDAAHYTLVKRRRLTRIFVIGDIVSFLMQGAGGSVQSSADRKDKQNLGKIIIVAGLSIQVVFFDAFMIVTALFHRRTHLRPTFGSETVKAPWQRYFKVLYTVGVLIMIRSIFRVVEYIQGRDGELQSHEIYFYIFDALLMFIMSVVFNFFHPNTIIALKKKGELLLEDRRLATVEV